MNPELETAYIYMRKNEKMNVDDVKTDLNVLSVMDYEVL